MLEPIEAAAGRLLRDRGWTLGLGESCTSGLVAHRVTEVAGSSDYFLGGILAYSNPIKERFLNVASETLETYGAVSEQTAIEMARGARNAVGADVGVSVTGIAGPGGGSEEKPVGLTFIGVSAPGVETVERYVWEGDRTENKAASAEAALQLLVDTLESAG